MSDYLPEFFGGNEDAARLMDDLCFVAHVWDDLIDNDNVRSESDINKCFTICLFDIPSNPFYTQHMMSLLPLIYTGCLGFMTANKMERSGDKHQIEIAHGLRYTIANVAAYAVAATNSKEETERILPTVWKTFMPERYEDYLKEHCHE